MEEYFCLVSRQKTFGLPRSERNLPSDILFQGLFLLLRFLKLQESSVTKLSYSPTVPAVGVPESGPPAPSL